MFDRSITSPFLLLVALSTLGGCSNSVATTEAAAAELIGDGLLSYGPISRAEFPQGFQVHSVDGDTEVEFAVQPSDAPGIARGVHAVTRPDLLRGRVLADVTPPPEGWATPLSIVIEDFDRTSSGTTGTFLVLDAGVTPANIGMAPARLYRYDYRYRRHGGLTTTLRETHYLPLNTQPLEPGFFPDGVFYPGQPGLLTGGRVMVVDTIWGSVWVSDANLENWTMQLIDPRFGFAIDGPVEGVGLDASGEVSPYIYAAPAPFPLPPLLGLYPGIHSIVYANRTDEACFPVTHRPGGLYCIGLAALLDTSVPPFAKSGDFMAGTWGSVRVLVPPTPGVSDLTNGVAYDRYAPNSPWLYWQRAPADVVGGGCNRLRRVHLETSVIQELACDNEIFSWANEIAALPPLYPSLRYTTILSSVGQQYNNPDVNAAITTPSYFSPSRMPLTHVSW